MAATEPYYFPSVNDVAGAQFFAELDGEVKETPQRGLSIGTLYNIRHGVTGGQRKAVTAMGPVGRGSLIFQNVHTAMALSEMLRVTPNAAILDNAAKREFLAKGLLPLTDHFIDIVLGQKWVADSRLWADHAGALWTAAALPINTGALMRRKANLAARCESDVNQLVLAPHEVDLALGVRFPPPQSLWRHRINVLDAALLQPANIARASKQLQRHLTTNLPFETLENLRCLERHLLNTSSSFGEASLPISEADYCAAAVHISSGGHPPHTPSRPSRIRAGSGRSRNRVGSLDSVESLAGACADVLAHARIVRFCGWLTRPHGLPMAAPLDKWDLPNMDPLFDRLSIDTYPHVSRLISHWDAHCPEHAFCNTLCVCTLAVFIRLTYMLPLFCDAFDDGVAGPRDHLFLLRNMHEHLEYNGALYVILKTWEVERPLPLCATTSEREALRRARYTNCMTLDAIFELLRHFRDHASEKDTELEDWLAEAPGLGEVFENVLIRELQLYLPAARRDVTFRAGPGSAAFLSRFGVPRALMVDVMRAMQRKIPERTAVLIEDFTSLPALATRVLCAGPLAYRVVESHCCEGLHLIRALLVGLPTWRGKPLKQPKNTFSFYQRGAPPTTVRVGVLDAVGGSLTIEVLDLAITAEVGRAVAAQARKVQQALVTVLDDGECAPRDLTVPPAKKLRFRKVHTSLWSCYTHFLTVCHL